MGAQALLLASPQDSTPVLSQSPNWEGVPVLGVTDHAVLVEHSYDLLYVLGSAIIASK